MSKMTNGMFWRTNHAFNKKCKIVESTESGTHVEQGNTATTAMHSRMCIDLNALSKRAWVAGCILTTRGSTPKFDRTGSIVFAPTPSHAKTGAGLFLWLIKVYLVVTLLVLFLLSATDIGLMISFS